jgi:hypothetical protein
MAIASPPCCKVSKFGEEWKIDVMLMTVSNHGRLSSHGHCTIALLQGVQISFITPIHWSDQSHFLPVDWAA